MNLKLSLETDPKSEDKNAIFEALHKYNVEKSGSDAYQEMAIFARDDAGKIVGGLTGRTAYETLEIKFFWMEEKLRGGGHGTKLLKLAEEHAFKKGCRVVHLDTYDFQAPGFYEKHGYTLFGRLDRLIGGHSRLYYLKRLD